MLEEEGVLRCCLYVLVPSAAKKREPGCLECRPGAKVGKPDLSWQVVSQAGSETGLDIGLILSRKLLCPCLLPLPPSGLEGKLAEAGLGGSWEHPVPGEYLSRAQPDLAPCPQ